MMFEICVTRWMPVYVVLVTGYTHINGYEGM